MHPNICSNSWKYRNIDTIKRGQHKQNKIKDPKDKLQWMVDQSYSFTRSKAMLPGYGHGERIQEGSGIQDFLEG